METEKKLEKPASVQGGTQVFEEVTTASASEIGITLRVDEEVLKTLDDIQEETIKAAQEHQKFAWR